ncbi:DUF3168 domain-containing protein [Neomegalonema sp.]|uniref:DUF3168 domain-containing protein n=1 Tax=Neomegalonema sp. TaxID=2039713 RepID=UPI00261A5CD1|nr:DUF3168 domain-containing protein [Neomegalonema sp.]MDD2869098.1 DUF3168 domain-containing protein [Neomegalonema sp.]
MTAALSWPLHRAIFAQLSSFPALTSALGGSGRVFDAPPHADGPGAPRPPYLTMGDETTEAWDARGHSGALHRLSFEIWSRGRGFAEAKRILSALCDALDDPSLVLTRGRLIHLRFEGSETRREEQGETRLIRAVFSARVEDDES